MPRFLARLVDLIAPPLTIRRQFLILARQAPRTLRTAGVRTTAQKTAAAFRRYRRTGALIIPPPPLPPPPPPPQPLRHYAYVDFLEDNTPNAAALQRQREAVQRLAWPVHFSLMLAAGEHSLAHLQATLNSLQAQSYPHWELCFVTKPQPVEVRDWLAQLSAQEPRLQLHLHDGDQDPVTGFNAALAFAQGDFCLLLDPGDRLAPHLLYEVAQLLNAQPELAIIYFDEDSVAVDAPLSDYQAHADPWFKPGWSPELMWSTNLLAHAVARRSLVEQVGHFDPALESAAAWDWALRAVQQTQAIAHLPKVLYHCQRRADHAPAVHPEILKRCLQTQLARIGATDARLELAAPAEPRLFFATQQTKISIIILATGDVAHLRTCLTALCAKTDYAAYEIILVAPASVTAETSTYLQTLTVIPQLKILSYPPHPSPQEKPSPQPLAPWSLPYTRNWAAQQANGELLLFLDSAIEVQEPGWLAEMVGWVLQPAIGVVGARLLRPDGTIQHNGLVIGLAPLVGSLFAGAQGGQRTLFGATDWYRNCSAVTGACLLVRRTLFTQLQGFDAGYAVDFADVEFCERVRVAGYRIVNTPFPHLIHHAERTGQEALQDVVRAACHLLEPTRQGDPYFHPQLAYRSSVPKLATPGEESPEQRLIQRLQIYDLIADDVSPTFGERLYQHPPQSGRWPQGAARKAPNRRILLVSHDLSLSGAPLMLYALAEYLLANGDQVTLFAAEEGPLHALYDRLKIPVTVEQSLIHCPSNALAIAQVVHTADLIIANTIVAWRALPVAKAFGLPAILWIHEAQPGVEFCKKLPGLVHSLPLADAIIFPTQVTANLYPEYVAEKQGQVIPYGLAPQSLEKAAILPLPGADRVRIMCIGSLEPRKGQDFLLRSLALAPPDVQQRIELFLVGRALWPDYVEMVEALARTLPHVHFVGEATREQTMAYIRAADILILPSRDEVLPVILLEAMYHAKAIIATQVGGVAEAVVDGVTGFLVAFGDEPALSMALQRLVANQGLRRQLGASGRTRFYEYFTIDKMGQRFVEIIEELLV